MILSDPEWQAVALSLKVSLVAVACSLPFGIRMAWLLARRQFPGKTLLDSLIHLPLVLPPVVVGYLLLLGFGRRGFIGQYLYDWFGFSFAFSWRGAALASAVIAFPLMVRAIRLALEAVDSKLEQAARTLGVPEFALFLRVSLPLAWRGILAGLLLAFARSMGEFGATLMVAGSIPGRTQTLSIAIYEAVQAGQDEKANLLVILTSVVCIVILLAAARLVGGRRRGAHDVA